MIVIKGVVAGPLLNLRARPLELPSLQLNLQARRSRASTSERATRKQWSARIRNSIYGQKVEKERGSTHHQALDHPSPGPITRTHHHRERDC